MDYIYLCHRNIEGRPLLVYTAFPTALLTILIGMCDEKYIVSEYLFWGPLQVIIGLPKMESFFIRGF